MESQVAEGYNDKLSADEQIGAEEWIAAYLFENGCDVERGQAESMSEEYCQELAKPILLEVLTRFRPDLAGLVPTNELDMTPDQLREKYDALASQSQWGEHPEYTKDDWQEEAGQGNTRLGYWDWVQHQLEMNAENEEEEAE